MEDWLTRLLLTIGIIWLTKVLLDAFEVKQPRYKVISTVVAVVAILWLLFGFTYFKCHV